ncbi:DNA oxidative demethylase AlkB [Entomobacter blattae]|uniref:Alpha-ketoglutarate-dependent dioxygenase AlkB n=1 Tax=Entomobacter blattae TaxID=2762277 RepID=A0A7H1NRD1_9PROT|nr:DNA oxidative demethylase AlkB [Entomobacter blattae]QNT78341.1 Alpha-ketoglutarate-dependent dioxygenase AlkB [Entomobacter blattae]
MAQKPSPSLPDLFEYLSKDRPPAIQSLGAGAFLFRGAALSAASALLQAVGRIAQSSPFRHMVTPGGYRMGAAMTSCGPLGWVTDAQKGYRYEPKDPQTGQPWPAMPQEFLALSTHLAEQAGFKGFVPSTCLINRYRAGQQMGLHQDKDEGDRSAPVVAISLGLSATFAFGGLQRQDPVQRYRLHHGDGVVWGGASRLCYHGISSIKDDGIRPLGLDVRISLTFRYVVMV